MRRLNRIIEINEKSMYAVVEPYVTCAVLQAEAMKKGFTVHMIGAGCNTSAMPITAHQGTGSSGVSTSCGDRNTLAVEWVTPDGELIKFGSLGAGAGWFCGDGPGPSLRGLIHGPQGVMGGLGIFTKAALKLYPYFGPLEPELEGVSPCYRFKEMPAEFRDPPSHLPGLGHVDRGRDQDRGERDRHDGLQVAPADVGRGIHRYRCRRRSLA